MAALAVAAAALLATDVAAASKVRVGHTVERIAVAGSALGEPRPVDVHLWYPADHKGPSDPPPTVYASVLHGRTLVPERWDPLSWKIEAEVAREGAPIDHRGSPFPVIVFSHGSVNEPIDYAHTLELIAGHGFVVAAPAHVNNTQDDVRMSFINAQAGFELIPCRDGRPTPCSRPNVPLSMADRVRDISAVLDELPDWLGDRVDVSRAGVLGHSRGTVAALAAAGGSASRSPDANCQQSGDLCWPLDADPRVAAVMGMAIAVLPITRGVDFANVTVPTLLVAGGLDRTSPPANSEFAFERIASPDKAFLLLENATHRSFDSTYCEQAQAAGAIAQANPRAILDLHTFTGIAITPTSGWATEYCGYETFTDPVDITPLVESVTSLEVTPDSVPSTGLETDEVKHLMRDLAVRFFGKALKKGPSS